jgi:hypothetical protein
MVKNNVIVLLGHLDRKEMTRFREFCHSPYYNKHERVMALVSYLSDLFPDFSARNCSRKVLLRKLWPQGDGSESGLALVFTYTNRLLKSFLATEQGRDYPHLDHLHLLEVLRERKLYPQYRKALRNWEESLEGQSVSRREAYERNYRFASEADLYYSLQATHKKDLSIQMKQDFLDRFFLSEKLRDACEMLVRSKILKVEYAPGMAEAAVQEVESNPSRYADAPLIALYARIYRMIERQDDNLFREVRQDMQLLPAEFDQLELQGLYNHLLHYCVERINRGEGGFLGELLTIYKAQLDRELILEEGVLSEWHYKNIVTTGLRLGETDWVNAFIETWRPRLADQCRDSAYAFNKASWCYAVGDLDRVLDLLLDVEYRDIRYVQGVKALLLRTYYDKGEYEAFLSLAESFKQFLQRNDTLSDTRRTGFRNLVTFARRAFQLKMDADYLPDSRIRREVSKLREDIRTAGNIFNRSWLEEKLCELEGV